MISLALSLIAIFHLDVKLDEPKTTKDTFELAISRGAIAVQNAKTVKQANGDVLYFVTNATGMDSDVDFATGPIAHLRTRELPRGYAILLTPRAETTIAVQGGAIVATSKVAPVVAPAPAEIKVLEAPVPVAPRAAPVRSATPIDDRNSSPMRNFGLLAGLLAIGAAVMVYGKKAKKKTATGETAGIDLIAVKALGAKQRLAVVDACGDRLLIATSEQGVQLLSKLEGGTGVHKIPADFMATLAQAESASPVPTTHVTPVNTSKDLAGLVQLRARRATWTSSEPLV